VGIMDVRYDCVLFDMCGIDILSEQFLFVFLQFSKKEHFFILTISDELNLKWAKFAYNRVMPQN
jgi:hypothetical protein